jgi:hypothetical protein
VFRESRKEITMTNTKHPAADPAKPADPLAQPVPQSHEHDPVDYKRPLPKPGDKDYVAGQPLSDAEASATEAEVKKRFEEAKQRDEQAAVAKAQAQPPKAS